jgi:hypothetical protein
VVEAPAPALEDTEPVVAAEAVAQAGPVIEPEADATVVDAAPAADPVPAEPEITEPTAEFAVEDPASVEDPVADALAGESAVADAAVEVLADDMAAVPEPAVEIVEAAVADPVVEADEATRGPDGATPDDAVDIPASTGAIAAAGVAAYAVDESVLAILREEAEREAHARKADTAKPLETQTDLGLDAAIPPLRKGQVEVQTDPVSGDETPDDRHAIRRTRLPDVEEINSTLRPSELAETEADAAAMTPVAEGRSSFRSGFLLVMTLAILASAIYGSADAISAAVPALEGPLKGFVGVIDSLRLQLDGLMQSATVAIDGN